MYKVPSYFYVIFYIFTDLQQIKQQAKDEILCVLRNAVENIYQPSYCKKSDVHIIHLDDINLSFSLFSSPELKAQVSFSDHN